MTKQNPHPVPITLGKYTNPKNSEDHWRKWREEQLQNDRDSDPSIGTNLDRGRRLPVRYDD
jgi:hypothetical protein